ncbi:MAG TPA: efflux RND transporter periplasmic adaptor subunit [Vicinamibacteria bacterium]|nr:efflux RND transporter periplasmic adaptor subunit [Vicinamibacteria bacterium]
MPVRAVLLGGLAVVLLLGGGAALRSRAERVRVVPAHRGSLRATVSCAGALQPPPGGELRAPEGGRVVALLASEGGVVRKGEPLLRIDAPDLVSRSLQARDELLQVEAERKTAVAEEVRARKDVEQRRATLAADGRLLEEKALPRAAYEASEEALREAEARRQAAEARLQSLETGGDDPSSRLALARARARDLAARLEALTVRAPADGVVYGLPRRLGETVAAGQVVASVTDPGRPQVRVSVDQPDLPRIAAGQRLVVTFDGLPERRWEGTLRTVARGLRDVAGREVAEVLGEIRDPDRLLPLNASVNVEVVVGERSSALVIPRAALQRDGERRFVLALADGRAVRREVTLDLVGTSEVEVVSGLAEGEPVILPGVGRLVPGRRVEAAP